MPELPEVENLRLGLEKYILGQKIKSVVVNKPKLVSGKGTLRTASPKKVKEFILGVTGEKFVAVERRAKNLIFKLSNGKILIAHLKMTGQFVYKDSKSKNDVIGGHPIEISEKTLPNKHTHIIFDLHSGTLYFNDTRMFGYVLFYPNEKTFEKEGHFKDYGVEPLSKDFTLKYFADALKGKSGNIKALLMNQDIVTGIGNIYADESLFQAKINPKRIGKSLKPDEVKTLHQKIVSILDRAVKVGGSSVATYRLIDDSRGNYAREHKVYGKAGQNCVNCGAKLKKILIQSRTTVFCPNCQK